MNDNILSFFIFQKIRWQRYNFYENKMKTAKKCYFRQLNDPDMTDPILQFIPDIASTNRWLTQEVADSQARGITFQPFTAICTDYQAEGHGMGSNRWFSDRGKNILLSVYFTPRTEAARQFLFNQYFALATRQFLLDYLPEVAIKWPNDIYVRGQKIAGILIEHHLRGDRLDYTIAGIGININQDHFPEEIPHPTSLYLETGKTFPVDALTTSYWQYLRHSFDTFDWNTPIAQNEAYTQQLYQLGEYKPYLVRGEQCEAAITGVDDYGQLRLSKRDGEEVVCGFKEIVFL